MSNENRGAPGTVDQFHHAPVPRGDKLAHLIRGQEGLGFETPVVIDHHRTHAVVLERALIIGQETCSDGIGDLMQ